MVSCSVATCCAIGRLRFFCDARRSSFKSDRKVVDRGNPCRSGDCLLNYSAICGAGAAETLSAGVKMRTKEFRVLLPTLAMMTELLGKSKVELREFLCGAGRAGVSRGADLSRAVLRKKIRCGAKLRIFGRALRERLSKEARITLPEVKQRFASTDGSVRYLFGLVNSGGTKGI